MPEEETPTFEQLETDIVQKPQEQFEQTLTKWYNGELEKIKNGKYDESAKKRLTEELNSARDKMREDAKDAREMRDKKYSDGIAIARSFLNQAKKELESISAPRQIDHRQNFEEARQTAQTITAPNDTFIPDYEGWSVSSDGLKDENANNKTRWTLSGYLMALRIVDKKKADEEAKRAKDIYDKSDEGFWNIGKAFEYKHLQEDMGLQKYIAPLERESHANGYELGSEVMGLLCGYLKMAESINPAQSEQYNEYVFNQLRAWKGRLKYEPKDEKEYMIDYNRSQAQMPVMMEMMNPQEWLKKITEENSKIEDLRKDFDEMKQNALAISTGLKFNYQDNGVRTLLATDSAKITAHDEAGIKAAKQAIAREAFAKISESYNKIKSESQELQTRIEAIQAKNSAAKIVPDQEIADVQTRLREAKASFDAIELSQTKPLNDLASISAVLASILAENEALKSALDEMEKDLNKETGADGGDGGGGGGAGGSGGDGGGRGDGGGAGGSGGEIPGGTGGKTPGRTGGAGGEIPGGADKYRENWASAESVYSRFKTGNLRVSPNLNSIPARNDQGVIIETIPGGQPVQLIDLPSKGKKIDEVVFVKVAYKQEGKPADQSLVVWVDEGMLQLAEPDVGGGDGGETPGGAGGGPETTSESPEIREFLSAKNLKTINVNGRVWYQLGDPTTVPLAPGSQVRSSGNPEVDRLFLQQYVDKKMTAEEMARVNNLFQEARYASQFSFEGGAKNLTQLRDAYEQNFIKIWEYAGKHGRIPPGNGNETMPVAVDVPAELAEFAKEYVIHPESREALARIARDGEKPEGAMFDIWFNNRRVPCRLTHVAADNYVINWNGGSWSYKSLKEAMVAINDGYLISGMTYSALRNPAYYKMYESWAGKLKESRLGETNVPGEVQFELDWLGTRRAKGNPVVVARVYSYGGIGYRVFRDDIGLQGESVRDGFAANFGDLMKQLGHMRRWAQEEDFKKGPLAYAKEYNFSILSDPRHYYAAEQMIGRPIYFGMSSLGRRADVIKGRDSEAANATYGQEVVQLGLDWGGNGPLDRQNNGWVNLWVNEAGTLSYTVSCPARGVLPIEKRVVSMAEIFRDLAEIRKAVQK